MKTLAMAGALAAALGLTCLAQRASAHGCGEGGFQISANVGVSLGLHWTCGGCGCGACCGQGGYAGCDPYGCLGAAAYGVVPPAVSYPAYGYAAYPFTAPQPTAVANPPAAAPKKDVKESAEVQGVGYSYPAPYGYGYDYNYASYYGYPYYQDYGAWYGYGR